MTISIMFMFSMFWNRDFPILSKGFLGFIALLWLYSKYRMYHEITFINDTSTLDIKIKNLFKNSHHYLYIITPYFNAGENRLNCIKNALDNDAHVTILVSQYALLNKSTINELTRLQKHGCEILVHPNLHSKIYINETKVITGSVNLLKGSFDNSLEIGVETKNINEHEQILKMIQNDYLKNERIEPFNSEKTLPTGFCIRTKSIIPLNKRRPISLHEWRNNDDRKGEFCHMCAKTADTSLEEPLCGDCK